jgi:hypothetical protein
MTETKIASRSEISELPGFEFDATANGRGDALCAIRDTPSDWLPKAIRRLTEVINLPENWDSYGAEPVRNISGHFAHVLLGRVSRIETVSCPKISATPDGYVTFVWDDSQRTLELEFLDNGEICYWLDPKTDAHEEEEGRTTDNILVTDLITRI